MVMKIWNLKIKKKKRKKNVENLNCLLYLTWIQVQSVQVYFDEDSHDKFILITYVYR